LHTYTQALLLVPALVLSAVLLAHLLEDGGDTLSTGASFVDL
jgi:hypothetical protein